MPTAYGYTRVSSDHQAREGYSLSVQDDAVKRYFEYALVPKGYIWGNTYSDEAVSAKAHLVDRRKGGELNKVLERGDVVIFPKLDRGFRDTLDLLRTVDNWKERGVTCVFLDLHVDTSTDVGRLILTVMGAIARFERDRLGSRVREAHQLKKAQGGVIGGPHPPFGYKRRKERIGNSTRFRVVDYPDPYQRAVATRIIEWKEQGYSWEQIAVHLLESKVRCWDGRQWSIMKIRRAYKGELQLRATEPAKAQAGGGESPPAPGSSDA